MTAFTMMAMLVLPPCTIHLEKQAGIGKRVESFQLREFRGAPWSLDQVADRKLVVVAFLGAECPLARLYGPRLAQLAKDYEPRGVAFVAINSNQQDSPSAIGDYARAHHIGFPILKDVGNVVADRFGAQRTPEVFVLDPRLAIRYRGRIDDQYGIGYAAKKPNRRDLARALDELLAGKPVSLTVTRAPGCLIGRVQQEVTSTSVTYSKHIAPLLQEHCVDCHRPGEIGPFSMTSYDEVAGWSDTIEEVVRQGRMPPWHADEKYGHFRNDARLSDAEKQLIFDWIKNGAPQGDPRDLPPPVQRVDGWRIPKPDIVFRIPKPISVPATGDVPYQYVVIDPGFTEDKWVRAAEVRPGCRAVVHHILVFAQPPGGSTRGTGGFAAHWLAGHVPGKMPMVLPDGQAKFIAAGSRFLFQIHYTPNGAPQTDQSDIGLVFADPKTVRQEVSTEMAANPKFAIPPHDPHYRVEAIQTIKQDSTLLNMTPHTHLRGKTFHYDAIYPDGREEVLVDVPRYDFNWQNSYVLAEPKLLPKGTKIRCVAYYDNSRGNRSNPDPEATVRWGDQTWQEMMIGYFDIVPTHQDLRLQPRIAENSHVPPAVPLDETLQRLARQALESEGSFQEFAAEVHKRLPQVDRVCVSTASREAGIHIEHASYPGDVTPHFAPTGFTNPSRGFALTAYALLNRFISNPDLSKARGFDMKLASKTLGSSVHVPIAIDGTPGTVNFWSKQKAAFPQETNGLLWSIGLAVGRRDAADPQASAQP